MKKSLLKSALFVWFFWWTILFLFFNDMQPGGVGMIPSFFNGLILALMSCAFGVGIRFLSVYKEIEIARENLKPTNYYGLKTTLGGLPPVKQHPRASSFTIPNDLVPWFTEYRAKHPQYAAVFEAVLRIYEAHPIPASPVKGGHGGLNLRDHSFNVLREILIAKSRFSYVGSKTSSGKIRQGLTDKTYQFDAKDPAIPLLGFIHDLGKMNCYKLLPNGNVEEVKVNHDVQGSKVLAGLDEFKILTQDNQELKNSLCVIMAYYHHPVEMPIWANDHTRALTELLIEADNAASHKEGGYKAEYVDDVLAANNSNLQSGYLMAAAEGVAESAKLLETEITQAQDEESKAEADTPAKVEKPFSPVSTPEPAPTPSKKAAKYELNEASKSKTPGFIENGVDPKFLILGETLFKKLKEGIFKNSNLMDSNAGDQSIGFVKGQYFYFHDQSMRKYLQLVTGDNALIQDKAGKQNVHTYALMTYLMKNEWLYCIHEGLNYSSYRAAFTVEKTKRVDGKVKTTSVKYMIIVNEDAFADETVKQKIAETKLGITIVGNSWGDNNDFKLKNNSKTVDVEKNQDFEAFIGNTAPTEIKPEEAVDTVPENTNNAPQTVDNHTSNDVTAYLDDFLSGGAPAVNLSEMTVPETMEENILSHKNPDVTKPEEIVVNVPVPSITQTPVLENPEDEYIPPEERLGILAIIAKLQYSNNKKLSPIDTKDVGGALYLFYEVDAICEIFHYTKDDFIKDLLEYREKHSKKKIGTQTSNKGVFCAFIRASEIE